MSRITKEIASEIATKLTEKKLTEIRRIQSEQEIYLEEIYLGTISKEVKDFFKLKPNYCKNTRQLRVSGNGFNYAYLNTKNNVPCLESQSFEPTAEQGKELINFQNKIENLKIVRNKLKNEIENLLYNLRTYSKVILEFPEAEPFLPKNISNKLMININDIRSQLK